MSAFSLVHILFQLGGIAFSCLLLRPTWDWTALPLFTPFVGPDGSLRIYGGRFLHLGAAYDAGVVKPSLSLSLIINNLLVYCVCTRLQSIAIACVSTTYSTCTRWPFETRPLSFTNGLAELRPFTSGFSKYT